MIHLLQLENQYRSQGFEVIAGMDEAGRGPLAGPVVAACCIMQSDTIVMGVDDSKKLSEKKREMLFEKITEVAIAYGIGIVDSTEIDAHNILMATKMAFALAYTNMNYKPHILLIDGRDAIDVGVCAKAVVKGDSLCYSIACASIIAKVTRDNLMREYAKKYPGYLFEKHKGYGTELHVEKLKELGACDIHRRTFIKKFV